MLAPAASKLPDLPVALDTVLQNEVVTNATWASSLVAADAAAGCPLFRGPDKLAAAALRVINNFAFEGQTGPDWDALLRLLGTVRDALLGPRKSVMPDHVRAKWESKLNACDDAVRAARLLSRLGYAVPPVVIAQSDAAGLVALLRECLRASAAVAHHGGGTPLRDEVATDEGDAFARLWRDARDLHAFGFSRALSMSRVLEEFVRAALFASSWGVAERCAHQQPRAKAISLCTLMISELCIHSTDLCIA